MLPPIFRILQSDARVAEIVGAHIYRRGVAPPRQGQPYVTWFSVSSIPENTLSETPSKDRFTIQIDVWHGTDKGSEVLATAVRDALEPHCHQTGQPFDGRDPDTKLWRIALEFDFFVDRPLVEVTS
jgi:hypothetical protein